MKKLYKIIAVLLCMVLLSSCGGNPKKVSKIASDTDEHVNLKWYIRCTEPKGFAEVMEKANEYLNKKLNVSLDLVCVEAGDYDQKIQLALASNEEFDLVWTARWANKYQPNVMKGAYVALDDYLELPELSELKKFYSKAIWDAARVSGKIYGVPMNQVLYNETGIYFKNSLIKKYNMDAYSIGSMEDIENIYETVKTGEAGSNIIITTSTNEYYDQDKIHRTEIIGGVLVSEATNKVDYNWDNNMAHWKRMKDWNDKGYFPSDIATLNNTTDLDIFSGFIRYLPGVEGKKQITDGEYFNVVSTSDKWLTRNSIQSTLNAVSSTSKHPIRALKLIQLLQFDEYLLNLICYGIEGRDYTKDPGNPKRMIRQPGAYYISEFMVGNQFLAYLVPSYEDGVWEETEAENKAAKADPFISFCFDPTPVESEISQISAVNGEYSKILSYGLDDPEVVGEEYKNKLKTAGLDVVGDEINRQLDQWKKTQK